jgi:hypothetical protein
MLEASIMMGDVTQGQLHCHSWEEKHAAIRFKAAL